MKEFHAFVSYLTLPYVQCVYRTDIAPHVNLCCMKILDLTNLCLAPRLPGEYYWHTVANFHTLHSDLSDCLS